MDNLLDRYQELRKHLVVDVLRLDEELMQLPMFIQEAAELASEAADNENVAHHAYEVIKAEASNRLRNPDEGKAPSETQILSQLPLEEDVQDARNEYEKAQLDGRKMKALVDSLREKSRSLNKISDLILSGYLTPNSVYNSQRGKSSIASRKENGNN